MEKLVAWKGGREELPVDFNERSRQIGEALSRSRLRVRRSIRQCAAQIGTSPRRYREIEHGTVYVAAVELEELVEYLGVPPHEVWPQAVIDKSRQRIVVEAQPGESVEVIVKVAAGVVRGNTDSDAPGL